MDIDAPASCSVGHFQSMQIHVKSKLWSLERFVIQLLLHENLIVTGSTSCTIDVRVCCVCCMLYVGVVFDSI